MSKRYRIRISLPDNTHYEEIVEASSALEAEERVALKIENYQFDCGYYTTIQAIGEAASEPVL